MLVFFFLPFFVTYFHICLFAYLLLTVTYLYPISTLGYLNTYIALYFHTPKLPEKHAQPMETSFHPSPKLVPSLANYPLPLFTPLSLGVSPSLTQTCHSSFWRHGSNISLCRFLYFCAFAFWTWCQSYRCLSCLFFFFLLETLRD